MAACSALTLQAGTDARVDTHEARRGKRLQTSVWIVCARGSFFAFFSCPHLLSISESVSARFLPLSLLLPARVLSARPLSSIDVRRRDGASRGAFSTYPLHAHAAAALRFGWPQAPPIQSWRSLAPADGALPGAARAIHPQAARQAHGEREWGTDEEAVPKCLCLCTRRRRGRTRPSLILPCAARRCGWRGQWRKQKQIHTPFRYRLVSLPSNHTPEASSNLSLFLS